MYLGGLVEKGNKQNDTANQEDKCIAMKLTFVCCIVYLYQEYFATIPTILISCGSVHDNPKMGYQGKIIENTFRNKKVRYTKSKSVCKKTL